MSQRRRKPEPSRHGGQKIITLIIIVVLAIIGIILELDDMRNREE